MKTRAMTSTRRISSLRLANVCVLVGDIEVAIVGGLSRVRRGDFQEARERFVFLRIDLHREQDTQFSAIGSDGRISPASRRLSCSVMPLAAFGRDRSQLRRFRPAFRGPLNPPHD
jgi:hypothetical protein